MVVVTAAVKQIRPPRCAYREKHMKPEGIIIDIYTVPCQEYGYSAAGGTVYRYLTHLYKTHIQLYHLPYL